MKCTMILAAAAAPMAFAAEDWLKCTTSSTAAFTGLNGCDGATCPAAAQALIDTAYTDCGGMEESGVEWDTLPLIGGAALKTSAVACKCSGAEMAAPVFALAAAAMAFFA
jgi:hypothetical protein